MVRLLIALDRYERDIMPGHRSQSSEKTVLGYWRDQAAQIRMMDLGARLPALVEALAEAKGAASTANRYLGFLQRVIRKARSWKWTDRNPVDDVGRFPGCSESMRKRRGGVSSVASPNTKKR